MSSPSAEFVLLASDDPDDGSIEADLRAAGYQVVRAPGHEPALALYQTRRPDLVLARSLDTCRELRALPGGDTAVIALCAPHTALPAAQHLLWAGADDVVATPIERTLLLLRVHSLLRSQRLKETLGQPGEHDVVARAVREQRALLSLVVHDLKNSISIILVNGNLLSATAGLPDWVRESSRDILDAAVGMDRLVENLVEIGRSEAGTLSPRFERVELLPLIELCISARRWQAADRLQTIEIVNRLEGQDTVEGDRELLQGLVENLLDNALRHSPRRGAIRVELSGGEQGWIDLRVRDQGPGVPAAAREHLFDKLVPFDQAPHAHARTSRALALAFCHLAARVHGGRIWVDDDEPSGCCFSVRLPARQPAAIEHRTSQGG